MTAKADSSDKEANDVDQDEESNNKMEVEKLSRLKEVVHSSILSHYEAVKCSHVRSSDVTGPGLIQKNGHNSYQGREALGIQNVENKSFRRCLSPEITLLWNQKRQDLSQVTELIELLWKFLQYWKTLH